MKSGTSNGVPDFFVGIGLRGNLRFGSDAHGIFVPWAETEKGSAGLSRDVMSLCESKRRWRFLSAANKYLSDNKDRD